MVVLKLRPRLPQVPEFRVAYTVTTDKLDALYRRLKPKGVTMTGLLAKAAGVALAKHPLLFASVSWLLRDCPSRARGSGLCDVNLNSSQKGHPKHLAQESGMYRGRLHRHAAHSKG